MSSSEPNRRSKLFPRFSRPSFSNQLPSSSSSGRLTDQPSSPSRFHRSVSPTSSYEHNMSSGGHGQPETVTYKDADFQPPSLPFSTRRDTSTSNGSSRRSSFASNADKPRPQSLSVNYVPAKFTRLHAPGDYAHRRAKFGGGRDAFASNASRMGQLGMVDDDDGIIFQLGKGGLKRKDGKPKLRWNRFKWVLFASNTILTLYGMATLVSAILVWLNVFYQADVIRVGNRIELILSTVAAALITLTSLIGYSGILLNNRSFLAVYTLLLWVCLGVMVAPGYLTYKQRTFNLEGKINSQWSRALGTEGRLRIQDALKCCGYFSPFVEATVSPLCYARSTLPGCKLRYLRLERHVLETWYAIAFSLVPVHILVILAALLCSNHITYRFGKGLTPKRYRLDLGSMAVIMDEYASQIAAQYGPGLAAEAVTKSSSNLGAYPEQYEKDDPLSSRMSRISNLSGSGSTHSYNPGITKTTSRLGKSDTAQTSPTLMGNYTPTVESNHSTGYNSYAAYGHSSRDSGSDVGSSHGYGGGTEYSNAATAGLGLGPEVRVPSSRFREDPADNNRGWAM